MRFFDSTIALLASQILSLIAAFVINLAVSRTLGETGKGLVTLLVYVPSVMFSISHLGMGAAMQYFVSRKDGSSRVHLSNALLFPLIIGTLVVGVFCIGYDFWKPLVDHVSLVTLLPALIGLPLMIVYELCSQQLVAHGRIMQKSISDVVQTYSGLIAVAIVLLAPGRSAERVFGGLVFGWGVGALLNLYYSIRIVGLPTTPSWKLFVRSFRYGVWVYSNSLLGYILTRADFFLLVALQSSLGVGGVYSVAAGLTTPLIMVPLAAQTVLFPKTSAQSDQDANRSTPFYFRQLLLIMTSLAIIAALLSHPVLLMFGGSFVAGQIPMLILLVGTVLKGGGGILSVHVLGRGKASTMTLVTGLTLAVALSLNFLLIPPFGMIGAALATTGAYAVQIVILILMFRRVAGGQIRMLLAFSREDITTPINEGKAFVQRLKGRYLS